MIRNIFSQLVFGLLIPAFLLQGCQLGTLLRDGRQYADKVAQTHHLINKKVLSGSFLLQTWSRNIGHNNKKVHVYIEGDGRAWLRKYKVSPDPTPKNPLALELAAIDNTAPVLYIARPCMYLDKDTLDNCDMKYWTSHRYAPEVVDAIIGVIKQFVSSEQPVVLLGYSGGGTLAALVAAQVKQVTQLVTVSANLDHDLWNRHHKTTPLSGSLNAMNVASRLSALSQRHLVGENDTVVPVGIVQSYFSRLENPVDAKVVVVPGYDHVCCWRENWLAHLKSLNFQ